MKKRALVVHSGGMDSSICLAMAVKEWGVGEVLSLSFDYAHRHRNELIQAKKICRDWGVDHTVVPLHCLAEMTEDALTHPALSIVHREGMPPNTLVMGRNGLFAHLAGIHAHSLGAGCIYLGVMELEEANCGYRDCSRKYMDLHEAALRIDLDDSTFAIRTPLIFMTKVETMECAKQLGVLEYLLKETITCYEGVPHRGCQQCPACLLRNEGIRQYQGKNPFFTLPFGDLP